MDQSMQRMLAGLKEAIKAESDGYHFYMMAAQTTKDPQGRYVFEQLAQEELHHMQFLSTQYKSLLDTGKTTSLAALGTRSVLSSASPIFSPQIKDRIKEAHYEMSALSIGIQLEFNAIGFYKQQAEQAAIPEVQHFFRELAEWETGHYNALLGQQDLLKQDYWDGAGFAPF